MTQKRNLAFHVMDQDVREAKFLKEFQQRGILPAITSRYEVNGPGTYNSGIKPIDEIFVSSSVQAKTGGYLEYRESAGDHRPIWVDMSLNSVLGGPTPELPSFKARKLISVTTCKSSNNTTNNLKSI